MSDPDTDTIRAVYERLCRDSGYRFTVPEAAEFTARMFGLRGVDGRLWVWRHVGTEAMASLATAPTSGDGGGQ